VTDQQHTLIDSKNQAITVLVRRDRRLKKSSRWTRQADGSILLRIPERFPKNQIGKLLNGVAEQLQKQALMAERRTDMDLQLRAEQINKKYFQGKISWTAIRWVDNMESRLGSCTHGGATDGHIRISRRLQGMPDWVLDYVIAHELVHRLHANHSKEFWNTLRAGYPLTDQARGFIMGIGFKEGVHYEEEGAEE